MCGVVACGVGAWDGRCQDSCESSFLCEIVSPNRQTHFIVCHWSIKELHLELCGTINEIKLCTVP